MHKCPAYSFLLIRAERKKDAGPSSLGLYFTISSPSGPKSGIEFLGTEWNEISENFRLFVDFSNRSLSKHRLKASSVGQTGVSSHALPLTPVRGASCYVKQGTRTAQLTEFMPPSWHTAVISELELSSKTLLPETWWQVRFVSWVCFGLFRAEKTHAPNYQSISFLTSQANQTLSAYGHEYHD